MNLDQRIALEAARLQPRLLAQKGAKKLPPMGLLPPPAGNKKARMHYDICRLIAEARAARRRRRRRRRNRR